MSEQKYILKFKAILTGRTGKSSKKGVAILPISVGQPYHEDNKLLATIHTINEEFDECVIVVCDTLYKYMKGISNVESKVDQFYKECLEDGKAWLERNKAALSCLTIPYKIIHWDVWLNDKNFTEKKQIIDKLYIENIAFKSAINRTAASFLKNYVEKHASDEFNYSGLQLCVSYLIEETAVLLLWAESNFDFLLYPVKATEAIAYIYKNFISKSNVNQLKYLVIKLSENNLATEKNSNATTNALSINPYAFHQPEIIKPEVSSMWYGVVKAIMDSEITIEQKMTCIISLAKNISLFLIKNESDNSVLSMG